MKRNAKPTPKPNAEQPRPWKKLLLEADSLTGELGSVVYRRTKILVQVWNDSDFIAEVGEFKAVEILQQHCRGVAMRFHQLRELLAHYPNEDDWSKADFVGMYDRMVEAKKPQPRSVQKPAKPKTTKAAIQQVERERDHWKTRASFLEKQQAERARETATRAVERQNGRGTPLPQEKPRVDIEWVLRENRRLTDENEQLRAELADREAIITALRKQLDEARSVLTV